MSLHALYHRDDETVDADGLRMEAEDEAGRDLTDWEVVLYAVAHSWEPWTTCHLCERTLADEDPVPLCQHCAATAQAHARIGLDPDAEMDRAFERRTA